MSRLTRRKIVRRPKLRKNLIKSSFLAGINVDDISFLYIDILEYMYPRLLKFRDNIGEGKPCGVESREDWIIILDEILWFLRNIIKTKNFEPIHKDDWYRFNEAHLLFQRYFFELQL